MHKLTYISLLLLPTVLCQNGPLAPIIDISTILNHTKIFEPLQNEGISNYTLSKMLDASTKIPTGILDGNYFDLGNFDECYNIHEHGFYGKYCLGTIHPDILNNIYLAQKKPVQATPRLVALGTEYIGFHFAICVPSTLPLVDVPGAVTFDFCYSKDTEPGRSTGATITIAVLALFLLIIIVSTIIDIHLYYNPNDSLHELFTAFSFLSNGRKLFASTTNPEQLLCLNGIKAISMMWVILSHEYFLILYAPFSNFNYLQEFENDSANMFILGATVSVDTFLTVGGLVTVYTFLKSMDKGVKFNIILYYVHRILRLTPALLIAELFYMYLVQHFGNGPLWKIVDMSLVQNCEDGWWSTLLYISNYLKKESCVPQSWYLSVDMQLYILSPLVLIPLYRWPKYGLMVLGTLVVAGFGVPFGVSYGENVGSLLADPNFNNVYYIQPYTRFGPYVIGMLAGYFIYKIKTSGRKPRLNPMTVSALWLLSLTGLVACLYAGHDIMVAPQPEKWANSFYLSLNRPAWALSLCGVIFLCVFGYGGVVNAFLALPIFQFLTKLSYSMYLVHLAVIVMRYSSMRQAFKFTHLTAMHNFWGDFMLTLVVSLVLCLAFESPIIIIEKHLFGSRKSSTKVPESGPKV